MRIGVFGGSFNPIHVGHISLARQLRQSAGLDEVWLMVSPQNPLKQGDTDLLDDHLRYQMVRVALHGEVGIKASDYELHLPKPSYTWNTLQHLTADYPQHTFVLLIGGDNWAHFQRWRNWKEIMEHHEVVAYPREGYPGTIEMPLLNVSSTEIRERVRAGENEEDLVPKTILPLVRRFYGSR